VFLNWFADYWYMTETDCVEYVYDITESDLIFA